MEILCEGRRGDGGDPQDFLVHEAYQASYTSLQHQKGVQKRHRDRLFVNTEIACLLSMVQRAVFAVRLLDLGLLDHLVASEVAMLTPVST